MPRYKVPIFQSYSSLDVVEYEVEVSKPDKAAARRKAMRLFEKDSTPDWQACKDRGHEILEATDNEIKELS